MYHPYHAFNDYYIVLVHLLIINVKCHESMQIDFYIALKALEN